MSFPSPLATRRSHLICRLGTVTAALLWLGSCASVPRAPRASLDVRDVTLIDVSFTDIAMAATVDVRNMGGRPLHIEAWRWTLTADGRPEWSGTVGHSVDVPAGETATATVPVAFHLGPAAAAPAHANAPPEVGYRLRLEPQGVNAGTGVFRGRFKLPAAPVVRLTTFTVRALSYEEATVQADLAFTPASGHAHLLTELDCTVALDGRPLVRLRRPGLAVPLASEAVVPLVGHIPLGRTGQATAAILRRQAAQYHVTGHAVIETREFGALLLPLDVVGAVDITHPH